MKKMISGITGLTSLHWLASPVFAQISRIEVTPPEGAIQDFSPVISGALTIIIAIAALICLVYLIWGGIEWMTSGGEKTAVSAAKAKLTAAFIGLIIVLAAFAIIKLLEYLFGFDILEFEFPKLY